MAGKRSKEERVRGIRAGRITPPAECRLLRHRSVPA
nr:MAG TPA: hypothetical protein [Caudoviricetes sp.]